MSKLKLTDVEWGEFKIGDIFEITRGKRHIEKSRNKGNIPYYSASSVNNGVTDFISNPLFTMKNKIVVTTFCDAFYAINTFTASDEMTILDNKYLNKYNGLFISNSIMSNKSKYAFGRKAFTERVREQIILLPIDSQGQLNWQFMEDYIKQEQKVQAQQVIDYYERKLVELSGDVVDWKKVEWKTFQFTEVFQEIQRGKRLTRANQTDGLKPYISSTAENNGVDGFIGNNAGVREFENVLTLANSGSVGSTFYQQFEFVASDHVTALKSENADKYAYLFLSSVVKRLEEKYSFNREINDTRIKREKIILPAEKNGNPDFQYMSDFVKKLELDKVQEVLEYIYIYPWC